MHISSPSAYVLFEHCGASPTLRAVEGKNQSLRFSRLRGKYPSEARGMGELTLRAAKNLEGEDEAEEVEQAAEETEEVPGSGLGRRIGLAYGDAWLAAGLAHVVG